MKLTKFTERKLLEYITQEEARLMSLLEKNFKGRTEKGLIRGYDRLKISKDYLETYLNETKDTD